MKKTLGTIGNIIMILIYIPLSFVLMFTGLFLFSLFDWSMWSVDMLPWFFSVALLMLTPVFCIGSIVVSIIRLEREEYAASLRARFFPFIPFGVAVVVMFFLWIFQY